MKQSIQIFVVIGDDAKEHKKRAIKKLSEKLQQYIDSGILIHTYEAMTDNPEQGEAPGNCHNIALGFMTDLINAGCSQGWFWLTGENKQRLDNMGNPLTHSWLEFDGFAVDATEIQRDNPEILTISIGEAEHYYKAKKIKKITRRFDSAQTRRWIFRKANKEKDV